jgi:hypothetical protein
MGETLTNGARADRRDRLIAFWKKPGSGAPTHPLQLFESMLWALQGATRSSWISVSSADLADVVVLHEVDRNELVELWQRAGKIVIVIVSQVDMSPTGEHLLAYPFRVAQVRELLNALDLKITAQSGEINTSRASAVNGGGNGVDSWTFLKTLRTLREVQNADVWLVGRRRATAVLWLRGDCREYSVDPETLQALRTGELNCNEVQLESGVALGAHRTVRPAEELTWFCGYHSPLELAPWLATAEQYSISRWPNFGLIRPSAAQLRVTALLAETPLTVEQLAVRAHVGRNEVVRILNALSACALLTPVRYAASVESGRNVVQPVAGLKSLLRLMRKHFALGGAT